jgi:hypothetical protein
MGWYLPTVERFRTRTMGRGCPRWFLLPGERFPEPRLVIPRGEGTTTFSPSQKAPSTTPRARWMANWGFPPRRCSLFSLRDGGGGLGATHQRARGCGVPNICSPRKGCGTNQQWQLPWTALRGIVARGPSMVVATETIRSWWVLGPPVGDWAREVHMAESARWERFSATMTDPRGRVVSARDAVCRNGPQARVLVGWDKWDSTQRKAFSFSFSPLFSFLSSPFYLNFKIEFKCCCWFIVLN